MASCLDMGKSSRWTVSFAERIACAACAQVGLSEPSLIRFSESGVFRSDGIILRVDQGFADKFSGDALCKMVTYMDDLGVKTTPTAGLATLSGKGVNVTFYEFIPKAHDSDWGVALRGFGEQIRLIHELADIETVAGVAPAGVELDLARRRANGVVSKLRELQRGRPSLLDYEQVELLYERAVLLSDAVTAASAKGDEKDSPQVVLHGDAHFGNIHPTDSDVLVVDFEDVGFGSPLLDHVDILLADRLFDADPAYEAFCEGYGADLSGSDGLGDWLELTALVYISWAAALGRVSDPHRQEALRRFSFWEEGLHLGDLASLSKRDVPYLWNTTL